MNFLQWLLTPIATQLDRIERQLMALQDDVNALTEQVRKGTSEVLTKIGELETANPDVDLSELRAAAEALDNIVPDQEPPTE